MTVTVHNMHHLPGKAIPEGDASFVYIGRPRGNAPLGLGNPFKVGEGYAQGEAVVAFRDHVSAMWRYPDNPVRQQILALAKRSLAGEELKLVCWCKPRACHGDVIKEAVDNLVARWQAHPPAGPQVSSTRKRSP